MYKLFTALALLASVEAKTENYGQCSNKLFRQVSYKSADCTGEIDHKATDLANQDWAHYDWGVCRQLFVNFFNYQCSDAHFKMKWSTDSGCTTPLGDTTIYKWGDCTIDTPTSSYKYIYNIYIYIYTFLFFVVIFQLVIFL